MMAETASPTSPEPEETTTEEAIAPAEKTITKKRRRWFWQRRGTKKREEGEQKRVSRWLAPLLNIGIGEERSLFMENLAMLLESGMDVVSVMQAVKEEVRTRRMKTVLTMIEEDVTGGRQLWKAIERVRILKPYVVSLIRIGENAGRLVENLRVIVIQQQKERSFRSKMRSAMAYPVLVLSIAFVIGVGLTVYILPRLESVFGSLNIELPLLTRILLAVGSFTGQYGSIVLPVTVVVMAILFYFIFFFKKTKKIGQWLFFHVPGVRRLIREIELSRMGYVLGTLLQAGLPIVDAIRSLQDATVFYAYERFYGYLADQINQGQSFRKSFRAYKGSGKIVPAPIQQMIVSSERSGRLPDALIKVGEIYEAKTETTAKNLTTVLEPVLLVIVWGGVATVALAVILPIYGLIGGLNEARTQPAPEDPAQLAALVTPAPEASPTPEVTPEPSEVQIGPAAAGVIDVLAAPDATAAVVTQVEAGGIFVFESTEEDADGVRQWYQIVITEGEDGVDVDVSGWVPAALVDLLDADGNVVVLEEPEVLEESEVDAVEEAA